MKSTLLFISLCSLAIPAGAQSTKTAASSVAGLSALRTETIRLNDPHDPAPFPSSVTFRPFSQFEVIDERPDTTRIGVHGNLPMHSHEFDRQLIFPGSAAQELTHYLNRHFVHPDAPDTVLVILRQLWLSDTDPYFAGADPYREDQLGGLALSMEGLARRDALVFDYARRNKVPVAITLAGGYARRVEDTVQIHVNTILAAREAAQQNVKRQITGA